MMKRRLTMALAAGALAATMLASGAVAIDDACEATDPTVAQLTQCIAATRAELKDVYKEMDRTAKELQKKLKDIGKDGGAISLADIAELQALQASLAQLSSTSTVVVSASNSAISSMARNIKG